MSNFVVKHVIVSLDDYGKPKIMSLHLPIDGKMRVHTIFPGTRMYEEIMKKLFNATEPIILEAEFVQLECPTFYALFRSSE